MSMCGIVKLSKVLIGAVMLRWSSLGMLSVGNVWLRHGFVQRRHILLRVGKAAWRKMTLCAGSVKAELSTVAQCPIALWFHMVM